MGNDPQDHGFSSPPCLLGELDEFTAGYWNAAQRGAFYMRVLRAADTLGCATLKDGAAAALCALGSEPSCGATEALCWSALDALLADAELRIRQPDELERLAAMRTHIARHHGPA